MSQTILDRITEDLLATLRGVTRQAGYHVDLTVEEPDPAAGNKVAEAKAILVQESGAAPAPAPAGYEGWRQPYGVLVDVTASGAEDLRAKCNAVGGDLVRALCLSRTASTRSGLAIYTQHDQPLIDAPAGASRGEVLLRVRVWYETVLNDPFNLSPT